MAFISGKIGKLECTDVCVRTLGPIHAREKSVMDRFVGQFATHPLVSASSFLAYRSVLNDCRPS
jgi:hypothetical protein